MKRHLVHAVLIGALAFTGVGTALPAAAGPAPLKTADTAIQESPEAQKVNPVFSDKELKIMAESSGRTVSEQREYVEAQAEQNNELYELAQKGNDFDGAFFNEDNELVVQASAGSLEAKAAKAKGLEVRDPQNGESKLNEIVDALNSVDGDRSAIASIAPEVIDDRVVITVSDADAKSAVLDKAAEYGDAVTVVEGERNILHTTARGGDKVSVPGSYCSAGFPASTTGGTKVMIWAGHCVEGQQNFSVGGSTFGTFAATAFKPYDGKPDRDIGAIYVNAGNSVSTSVNTYGSDFGITNADRGAWQAPVGTDMCRTGATSGVTCGKVTGYNASVNYSDNQGRSVAQVSGLGTSSVCTAPGDSGGAYTAGGYAVGMTSGGPSNQRCGFNGGYMGGSSYFQPVQDALNYYGLRYGHR
ncbi:S1 family peptidase [Brevibacterium luteolum]|uniref:S1 family peptidase n=1 Tax=Brevibacterium luteolum TaxID=199591 RepID=UPI003EEA6487